MHKWFTFVSALTLSVGACAQANQMQQQSNPTREQRRVELRTVLQAQRNSDRAPVDDKATAGRQLTLREHAELRQQLREQRGDKPVNP